MALQVEVVQGKDASKKPASAADLMVMSKLGAALGPMVAAMRKSGKLEPLVKAETNAPTKIDATGEFFAKNDRLLKVRITARPSGQPDFDHNYVLVNPRTNEFYAMGVNDVTNATFERNPQKLPAGLRFKSATFSPVALDELERRAYQAMPLPPDAPAASKGPPYNDWRLPVSVWPLIPR